MASARPLRRVPWPALTPVELVDSTPWLLLQSSPKYEDEKPISDATATSPYAARRSPTKRVPLSPAQRAAKRMLKLRDEMEQLQVDDSPEPAPLSNPRPQSKKVNGRAERPKRKRQDQEASKNPSDAAREHVRLQRWLEMNGDYDRCSSDEDVCFSSEMQARVSNVMHATLGAGLWRDVVASPIAAEMTSESVFGGAVATRRSECPVEPKTEPVATRVGNQLSAEPKANAQALAAVAVLSAEIREDAEHCVAMGCVTDALETLQRGIDTLLHGVHLDEPPTRSFDYSAAAHALAARIQRQYRSRHRRRVQNILQIQHTWRRVCRRRRRQQRRALCQASALRIQRFYRHARFDRSARIIQRCLRLFRQFKAFFRLRYAVVLVLARERRRVAAVAYRQRVRRHVWRKLQAVMALTAIAQRRRLATTILQATWRGWHARRGYAAVLDAVAREEIARQHGEDAFVAPRLSVAMSWISAFIHETRAGRSLVWWRMAAPWVRYWRLQRRWQHVDRERRVAVVCGLFAEPNDVSMHSWTWLALLAVLLRGTPNSHNVVRCARPLQELRPDRVAMDPTSLTIRLEEIEASLATAPKASLGEWWSRVKATVRDVVERTSAL
ncbi:hypothetical protein ATCC90586_001259 [Pythium insidiosum]|nr:hypothetical protein ATCC90586_001259 [Pythium insidiosum]